MKRFVKINLTVHILKQKGRFIAYSPTLDLSTSGRTQKEATKRFEEASFILIEELERAGTLENVLRELGWRLIQKQWTPPRFVFHGEVDLRVPVAT